MKQYRVDFYNNNNNNNNNNNKNNNDFKNRYLEMTVCKNLHTFLSKFYKKTIISHGPPVTASRTLGGPRTPVWETLLYRIFRQMRKKNYFCGAKYFLVMSLMTELTLTLSLKDPHDDA